MALDLRLPGDHPARALLEEGLRELLTRPRQPAWRCEVLSSPEVVTWLVRLVRDDGIAVVFTCAPHEQTADALVSRVRGIVDGGAA